MKYWIGALTLISALVLEAQTLTGVVYDRLNNEPLVGATISVSEARTGTSTGSTGRFTLNELEPGRISLVVTYVGYEALQVNDVWIKSGKITEQDIYLNRQSSDLNEVVIMAPKPMIEPGRISITEEQINRFAATYYDPARLITSSPDIAVTNDQNNQISVRGLSPSYNVWKLEGAEIVNPNHLSNAGTFLDQPSATGGGVNMLSAQMLDRSSFLYSTFDSRYGNSVGGVFDMNLKTGTSSDRQYTAQASLIGLDLSAEGPFQQGGQMTYVANYRYSFTGLLTSFGVDFGGESIGFQDLSFSIATPVGDRSRLKVFGVGGLSFNDFTHKPYDESEVQKDRNDIFYNNKTGIIGAAWESGYDRGKFAFTAAYSVADNQRDQTSYNENDDAGMTAVDEFKREVISANLSNVLKVGAGLVEAGLMQNFYSTDNVSSTAGSTFAFYLDQWLSRPYVRMEGQLLGQLSGYLGVGGAFTSTDQAVEPRGGLSLGLGKGHTLSFGAGAYSQLLSPNSYWFDGGYGETYVSDNPGFYDLLKSYRGTFSHDLTGRDFSLHTEVFYYYFPEVHTVWSDDQQDAYTGGVSVSYEKDFSSSAYIKAGGSLFDSEVEVYENYFNTQYNLSLSMGKEWDFSSAAKNRRLSVDMRGMYQGGYQNYLSALVTPVSAPLPADFSDNHPYLRFDLRVVWKRYRENRTTSIALDLQNAANIQNQAYQYYDGFTGQWETQNNLGLIPILAYRVEW